MHHVHLSNVYAKPGDSNYLGTAYFLLQDMSLQYTAAGDRK